MNTIGDKQHCLWCGKSLSDPRQMTLEVSRQQYSASICSEQHEQSVHNAYRYMKKMLPVFVIGLMAGIALIAFGGGSHLTWAGLLMLGITIITCPFVTPQTVEMFGMKKSFIIARAVGLTQCLIAIVMMTGSGCGKATSSNPQAEQAATESALSWLKLIDEGKYAESWEQAASPFQKAVPKEQWLNSLKGVRDPLGKNESREVSNSDYMTSLPGAPDGQYVVIQFKADFEQKKGAVETVTPMLENGVWKVSGYYIK